MDKFDENKISRRDFLENTAKFCFQAGLALFLAGCAKDETSGSEAGGNNIEPGGSSSSSASHEFEPAYLKLHRTGELKKRAEELWASLEKCRLCPRQCGVNRLKGKSGFCRAPGTTLVISGYHGHFGEERPLVGRGGSGTIFLAHCGLRCVFCQNWSTSHLGRGSTMSISDMAGAMLRLQREGCHNINFVTPTHYSPHILKALDEAAGKGLRLPVVYNTCGWETLDLLKYYDGIVDIYLPDFKYWDSDMASRFSAGAGSYPELTRKAILEMNRQTGDALYGRGNIIQRGLMIRHLVMPNDAGGSENIMQWIADNLPKNTYVNIMAQYSPAYKAFDYVEISRRITSAEYRRVVRKAEDAGLTNLDVQGYWWLK